MAGSGVTRDELLFGLRVVEREIAEGSPSSADFEVRELRQSVERHGLDPGPHPSLKAIEERLEPALTQAIEHNRRLIECGDARHVCPLYAIGYVLDDIRSGEIPPAPTEAEVEELRAELAALRGTNRGLEATLASMKPETDRLRVERDRALNRASDQAKALDVAKAEIDALQDRNNRQREMVKGQVAEIARLKDEARTTETANRAYKAATQKLQDIVASQESTVYALGLENFRLKEVADTRQAEVARLLDANGRQAKRIADLESKAGCLSGDVEARSRAWLKVSQAIMDVRPGWSLLATNGGDSAVAAVHELAAARDERDALRDECEALKEKSFEAAAEIERLNSTSRVNLVFHTPDIAALRVDAQRIIAGLDEIDRKIEAINAGN